jgi:peroxiredoxin
LTLLEVRNGYTPDILGLIMVNIGDTAPAFTLKNTQKSDVSLADYAGKTVILAFYPGAFTGVCDKEMCVF